MIDLIIHFLIWFMLFPFKIIFYIASSIAEAMTIGQTKCPRCKSANVQERRYGGWHCNDCGKDFK